MSRDRNQRHQRPRPRSDGECEWVEDFLLEIVWLCLVLVGLLLLLSGSGLRVTFVEHAPAHGRDDHAAGELDDGQGYAEEVENSDAEELDDGEKNDVVDGDAARKLAIGGLRLVADQAEDDQRRAQRIDER
jgi:hypothetical protein